MVAAELTRDITALLNFRSGRRAPVVLQSEATECGLACLAMISCFHGAESDLASLRGRLPTSSRGTTLKDLMNNAAQINLQTRPLRCEVADLTQLQLPCILHWDMNHFVVLVRVSGQKAVVHDPAVGQRKIPISQIGKHFTGVAVELAPTSDFKEGSDVQRIRLRQFWTKATGIKRSLVQVLALSLLLQLFALASPIFMQTVVDDVVVTGDHDLLLALALGFGLLMLTQVATEAIRQYSLISLSSKLNLQLANNVFRHLIRLPIAYFHKRHMGDVVSRFGSINTIRQLLSTGLITAIVDGLMAIVMLVAIFLYSVSLSCIVLLVVALYAVVRITHYYPFREMTEESLIAKAKHDSHFMESVKGVQTIKVFQKENDRQTQWQNRLVDYLNREIRVASWNTNYQICNQLLFGLENIIIIYLAAKLVMGNEMTIGMLYAFMSFKTRFISSMDSLIAQGIELKMLGLHLNRLADIVLTPQESTYSAPESPLCVDNVINGSVEVSGLSYRFSATEPFVFENIHFKIEAGEAVAIVGPSGCGKTTLMKCLMGLLEPTKGEIQVDGTRMRSVPQYRSRIAAVMQEDALLSGSILDNIACFDPQVDVHRVRWAAHVACIHDEITRMPMQYNTLVGDMGSTLSGGQKQRVVLARALYRQPRILFMDEATSHLDVELEKIVSANIKQLNITRVMIAHRPQTISSADRQIVVG